MKQKNNYLQLIYKKRENVSGGAANEYECFQSHEGIVYRHGDHVFVESCREDPFLVGSIVSFKMVSFKTFVCVVFLYFKSEACFANLKQTSLQNLSNPNM